jgi:hypothetical protein
MNWRRARTNAEVISFVIGCEETSHLEREIRLIFDDQPINLDRLELRLRGAIGAVKRVRDSGLGARRLHIELSRFEKYCESLLAIIVGHPHYVQSANF